MGYVKNRVARRWHAATAEERTLPTQVVVDLPVMHGLKRDGMSVHPLEPDGSEIAFDDRHAASVMHYHLVSGGV